MITTQKRKIDTLLQSVNSPNGTNASLRQRLIAESPAPQLSLTSPDVRSPNRKKPRLSAPTPGSFDLDLDLSVELFPDQDSESHKVPQIVQSPSVEVKKQCKDYGTKFVKITSAAGKSNKDDVNKRELSEIGNIVPPGFNFNILKKKTGFGLNSGRIKRGYNGFGSHEKFVQPMGASAGVLRNKPLVKKTSGSKLVHVKKENGLNNKKAPPLPNLGGFLTQS